ncbi:flavin reductase family protein [Sphingobium sp.]|uniref:flavin reductase family protein n=1 Tax=Sphingobium sp. TaxID=1912891 RepID=UPI0028BE04E6|nr:flavin reductase family protein [Sphingobium sp.]
MACSKGAEAATHGTGEEPNPVSPVSITGTADAFRQAMRHFASSVTIVSTEDDGAMYGMTATSVTSVSMAPPAILACVNQAAWFHQHISRKGAFCVNVLGFDHVSQCETFGGRGIGVDRFKADEWREGHRAIPYFLDADTAIFCKVEQAVDHGTHTIFIGLVEQVIVKNEVNPLVYLDGGFMTLTRKQDFGSRRA